MDRGSSFGQVCSCGREFTQPGSLRNHQKTCKKSKKRLTIALAKAKELIAGRKRRETSTESEAVHANVSNDHFVPDFEFAEVKPNTFESFNVVPVKAYSVQVPATSPASDAPPDELRPAKRRRQLPSRFRVPGWEMHHKKLQDVLPQPPPALPPAGWEIAASTSQQASQSPPSGSFSLSGDPISNSESCRGPSPGLVGGLRRVLETSRNSFGLFRRYFSQRFPSHDPESEVDISSLSNIVGSETEPPIPAYGPYLNKNSFRLGEWYWNHGVQKSQADFKELVNIVGDVDFQPSEIRSANWDKINRQLVEGDCDKGEWVDEVAGWVTSPINISVPFHRYTQNPGPRNFVTGNFHHRSLVSVIREKLSNENDTAHFHFDPYELLWQPHDNQDPVRVHGELYTSPAFIEAHNALQESPSEPGCELPRVIVALMFWSDSTHLTNFGKAKLWPLYMFFGNESKYRRGKPSCNLCEHVAYFETVRALFSSKFSFSLCM
jgi:Plavaka transposase